MGEQAETWRAPRLAGHDNKIKKTVDWKDDRVELPAGPGYDPSAAEVHGLDMNGDRRDVGVVETRRSGGVFETCTVMDRHVEIAQQSWHSYHHLESWGTMAGRWLRIRGWREVLLGPKLNILLMSIPFTFFPFGKASIFTLSLLGIAPLAERLGFVTEQLAAYTNDTVGGLLNATFGNATEMIISIFALRNRLCRVVQLSLLGSVLSNMLLVLGCAFFFGGWKKKGAMSFGKSNARLGAIMLLVAMTAISLPAILRHTHTERKEAASTLRLSRFCSVVMLGGYAAYIFFLLTNDSFRISEDGEVGGEREASGRESVQLLNDSLLGGKKKKKKKMKWKRGTMREFRIVGGAGGGGGGRKEVADVHAAGGSGGVGGGGVSEDEESGPISRGLDTPSSSSQVTPPVLGVMDSILWMTIITVFISILSGFLVDAIQGASDTWHVPLAFISVVVLPIVGNAAEHASAVIFALNEKLDLSVSVAIGSSVQIAIFVIPFCVVIGWVMGVDMELDFHLFETATLVLGVLVASYILQDGKADWLRGLLLIICYVIASASFFYHKDAADGADTTSHQQHQKMPIHAAVGKVSKIVGGGNIGGG